VQIRNANLVPSRSLIREADVLFRERLLVEARTVHSANEINRIGKFEGALGITAR
jgi:hypothetical protein